MSIYALLKRNALAYCDPLPKQRRRLIMLIYENLESQARRIRLNRRRYYSYIRAEQARRIRLNRRRYYSYIRAELESQARRIRLNRKLYDFYIRAGVEYLLNPDTDELHRVHPDYFDRPHNLATAHLQDFIPCNNVGISPVHLFDNGVEVPFYISLLDELICRYQLDKCEYCFPQVDLGTKISLFRRGYHTARR